MSDDVTLVEAEVARETIVNEWLETNSVDELTFAQFFHAVIPLIRHTLPEGADGRARVCFTLYYRFAELKAA